MDDYTIKIMEEINSKILKKNPEMLVINKKQWVDVSKDIPPESRREWPFKDDEARTFLKEGNKLYHIWCDENGLNHKYLI